MRKLTEDSPNEIETLSKAFQASIQEDTYDGRAFGDAVLVLGAAEVQLRLSRDRAQLFVEVAPTGRDYRWEYINEILERLGIPDRHDPDAPLTHTADMLVKRRVEIVAYVRDHKAAWPAPRQRAPF